MAGRVTALLLVAVVAVLSACATERRVVARRGGLGVTLALDGSMAPSGSGGGGGTRLSTALDAAFGPPPGEPIEGEPWRNRLPDGEVLLVSRSPQQLVIHLIVTLQRQEHDLLFEQLISSHTKQRMEDEGRDPLDVIDWMVRREARVRDLLTDLRSGPGIGGVRLETLGRSRYRLSRPASLSVNGFRAIDIRLESGRFVLDDIE